jgi:hypothetical protein
MKYVSAEIKDIGFQEVIVSQIDSYKGGLGSQRAQVCKVK